MQRRNSRSRPHLAVVSMVVGTVFLGCAGHVLVRQPQLSEEARAFKSLADVARSAEGLKNDSSLVETFWARVKASGPPPLAFGKTAIFFFRGPASSVEWRGDMTSWDSDVQAQGERLGRTDVWWKLTQLDPVARLDYKIVIDGEKWMLDPLNPRQQLGGFGPNSQAQMPQWKASPWSIRDSKTPGGGLGPRRSLQSQTLGYSVAYRVYVPAGLTKNSSNLPSLYVTDGSDYWNDEMGAMTTVLDSLISAGKIQPLIAVFMDPWDDAHKENRRRAELVPQGPDRCAYCEFILTELVPKIEAEYSVSRSGNDRGIIGTSFGGLFAAYVAITQPKQFGRIGIQSPVFTPAWWLMEKVEAAKVVSDRIFVSAGAYERFSLAFARPTANAFRRTSAQFKYVEPPEDHSWGQWRGYLGEMLIHLFGS